MPHDDCPLWIITVVDDLSTAPFRVAADNKQPSYSFATQYSTYCVTIIDLERRGMDKGVTANLLRYRIICILTMPSCAFGFIRVYNPVQQ